MRHQPRMLLYWSILWLHCLGIQAASTRPSSVSIQSASTFGSALPAVATGAVDFAYANNLCSSDTSQANATGSHSFDPRWKSAQLAGFGLPSRPLPNATWLVTVKENNPNDTVSTFWFNTGIRDGHVQQYWEDDETQFSACAFILREGLSMNTIQLGRDDSGDCTTMFTPECKSAIIEKAEQAAVHWVTYNPTANARDDITASSLPTICQAMAKHFADSNSNDTYTDRHQLNQFPSACAVDFKESEPSIEVVQLTFQNPAPVNEVSVENDIGADTNINWDCPISDDEGHLFFSTFAFTSGSYDLQTRLTTPILSVFFNLANDAAQTQSINYAHAEFSCPRPTHFNKGSVVSPELEAGSPFPVQDSKQTSTSNSTHPNTAEIAGIAAAVSVVAIIVIVALIIWTRRRKAKRDTETATEKSADQSSEEGVSYITEEPKRYELSPIDRKAEIDGAEILETGGPHHGAVELDAVSTRWSINSSRPSLRSFATADS